MANHSHRLEGIVLHSLPFKDFERILTLFTYELGMIKALFPKAAAKKASQGGLEPLARAEFILSTTKSDLYICHELALMNQNLNLRSKLSTLKAAGEMVQAIKRSQDRSKPAPDLYLLFARYLEKLPLAKDEEVLVSSFYLKLLRYEGLLGEMSLCSTCLKPLKECAFQEGEALCLSCAPKGTPLFSDAERACLHLLNHTRRFKELMELILEPLFVEKIKKTFLLPG